MSTASWVDRPHRQAMTRAELDAMVDRSKARFDRTLFTVTPRERLGAVEHGQRLMDQAFVVRARAIVQAHADLARDEQDFVADEVALALGFSPTGASKITRQALALHAVPGMLEAIDAGMLTSNHALCVLRELDLVELSPEQRAAIGYVAIHRAPGKTPGELMKVTRGLILQVDLPAAMEREQVARRRRGVSSYQTADGQGLMRIEGPVAQIAELDAVLAQLKKDHPRPEGVTAAQWEFDLMHRLITGELTPGQWQVMVVTPFSTAIGGDLELAEIPRFGPILPATARQLLEDAEWSQIAVDQTGAVIAVGDPHPHPAPSAAAAAQERPQPSAAKAAPSSDPAASALTRPTAPGDDRDAVEGQLAEPHLGDRDAIEAQLAELRRVIAQPPADRLLPERLETGSYVATRRLKRYLRARDRHCVFPGCHQRVTDVDHRIPWPLGPTSPDNCQLLCRRHHRAKQAIFTVSLTDDGDYLWTNRDGWQFLREREGY